MVHQTDNLSVIRGLILPSDWDERGNVTEIAISTFSEEEYHVDHDGIGQQLLARLQQKVEASGWVRHSEGEKWIRIRNYTILGNDE